MKKIYLLPLAALALSISYYFCNPKLIYAVQSLTLRDSINNTTTDSTASHSIRVSLPINAEAITTSDYIQVYLPSYSEVTEPTQVTGNYGGSPVFSVDTANNTAKVTGITVVPGASFTIEGISARNPVYQNQFQVNVFISEDEDGNIVKNAGTTVPIGSDGSVSVTASIDAPQGRLRISGYTAPSTYVIFSENEAVIGSDVAGPNGFFSKYFPSVAVLTHNYAIYGIDSNDLSTSPIPIELYTPAYQETSITGLLLSPTIQINSNSILQGQTLSATGSAKPGSTVTLFTENPLRTYTASASSTGSWTYDISDTSSYVPGDYQIYALAQLTNGQQSLTSTSIGFRVTTSSPGGGTACGDIANGDLNCDDIINLTDFSILMYYWGSANATADINSNGSVDLTDFSIMMYYWGT